MPTTTARPSGAQVSDSITPRTSCRLSPPAGPAHDLKAPNGRARAELVATTHRTSHPVDAAEIVASRAIRLFPTPTAPHTTIPQRTAWSQGIRQVDEPLDERASPFARPALLSRRFQRIGHFDTRFTS